MGDYQIPKLRVDVTAALIGGAELRGAVFISENALSYTGKPRLEDFLNNEPARFFPFRTADGSYSLLNKEQLMYLKTSEEDFDEHDADMGPEPKAVEVFFPHGPSLKGEVFPDLPEYAQRVSDFFNQDARFLPMYQGKRKVILNTSCVLYVRD